MRSVVVAAAAAIIPASGASWSPKWSDMVSAEYPRPSALRTSSAHSRPDIGCWTCAEKRKGLGMRHPTLAPVDDTSTTLLALGAATLGESGGRPMHPRIRAAWDGASLAAPAYAVTCAPGDNLAVHAAVVHAPPGSAL